MTKVELLAQARLTLDDSATPYRWSDAELTSYIEDAEQEAAERATLIEEDGNATYCTISLVANTATYATQTLVFEVLKARVSGQSKYLERTSREELDRNHPLWEDASGVPTHYYHYENKIRVYPNPAASGSLLLVVHRLPVRPMLTSPEIHARYHFRMLDWAYRQAFLKRDEESYNPTEALKYETMFERSFGKRKDAKLQTRQRRRTPYFMRDDVGEI